jgi:lipoprotein-anchoring transpeptidase ErfK/SrfK
LRNRTFILVAGFLALLCVLAVSVYAYDSGRDDTIAKGVRIAGIDVGGMSSALARNRLENEFVDPLRKPISITRNGRTWKLGPREAQIGVGLSAAIDEALSDSHEGNILTRTVRGITGGTVHAHVAPRVTYSDAAVVRLLDRVRSALNRPAKDASLTFRGASFSEVDGHDGLAFDAKTMHQRIKAAITSPTAGRRFHARVHRVRPSVTRDKLADRYSTLIMVDRKDFRLTLYKRLKAVKTYGIAVGRVGLETPAGLYHIQNKAIDPAWHVPNSAWAGKLAGKVIPGGAPDNPIKSRWMGIFDGAGIHGTSEDSSIGSAASHGCIRMRIPEVKVLYDEVPVGAPVYIA